MGHLGSRAFASKHSRRVTNQFYHRNIKTYLDFYNFYIFCFYISMILSNMVILYIIGMRILSRLENAKEPMPEN